MRAGEREQFTTIIAALAATFGREVSEALYTGYWLGLQDLSLVDLKRAAGRAMTERHFMPVPAELRELAGELRPEDRAVKAWAAVQQARRGHDYYDTILFDDPLTTATVRHLWHDWMQFTLAAEAEKEHWLRKEFERVYLALMRSGIAQSDAAPLLGYYEQENRLYAQPAAPPLVIACGLPALPGLTYTPKPVARIGAPPQGLLESIGTMPETGK